MLHPSAASSFQLVSAIPAAHLTAGPPSRAAAAAAAPSLQYIVPPLALSDAAAAAAAGGKLMQMVSTSTSQSVTPQLAAFQLATLPRAAIQLGSGPPQVVMLCPQSQSQQQQQQPVHNSPLSSVLPVVLATGSSHQLGISK